MKRGSNNMGNNVECNLFQTQAAALFFLRFTQGLVVRGDSSYISYCTSPADHTAPPYISTGTILCGHLTESGLPVLTRIEPPV